jgi:hypothetical protein
MVDIVCWYTLFLVFYLILPLESNSFIPFSPARPSKQMCTFNHRSVRDKKLTKKV